MIPQSHMHGELALLVEVVLSVSCLYLLSWKTIQQGLVLCSPVGFHGER